MSVLFVGGGAVLVIVLLLGFFQMLGETRLAWIFPIISVVALTVFLVRCMVSAPAPHF
jgi:hypothetical protein